MNRTNTYIVIRHGESDANARRIISDKNIDHSLTANGIRQARKTAELLKDAQIDLFVSSTRQRAMVTAQMVNEHHGADMILTDDLIERYYGIFSGMDKANARQMMIDQDFDWINIPNSEPCETLDKRVGTVLDRLEKEYTNKTILISTHEDVVRACYRLLDGLTLAQSMELEIANSAPHHFRSEETSPL